SLVRLYDESKIALLLSRRDITFAASHYSVRTEKGAVGRDLSADSQVMQLNASCRRSHRDGPPGSHAFVHMSASGIEEKERLTAPVLSSLSSSSMDRSE
ncbi:hypothetical protein ALC53_07568, partial [Atta colombica]